MTGADLVIQDLADSEAAALERLGALTEKYTAVLDELASARETLHVSVAMLARTTFERDRALAALYQRAGVATAPDEAAIEAAA